MEIYGNLPAETEDMSLEEVQVKDNGKYFDPENLEGERDSCWQLVFRFVTSTRASVLDWNA